MTPREILAEGQALLALAEREEEAFAALLPLVESSVKADLCEEHHELAEDLGLLDWLLRTTPDSPDTATLAASLGRRMRQHLDRDGRLLKRAVAMAAARREAS